jgi:hypothetical protein
MTLDDLISELVSLRERIGGEVDFYVTPRSKGSVPTAVPNKDVEVGSDNFCTDQGWKDHAVIKYTENLR